MPIIYRYIHVPRKDGTLRHAPFIPVIVRNKFEQVMKVVGLVDSGADTTVVPRDLADLLGMKENAASTETGGIGGKVKVKRSRLHYNLQTRRAEGGIKKDQSKGYLLNGPPQANPG